MRFLAEASLLLARFNHSRGSSGGKQPEGSIYHLPVPQSGLDDQRVAILEMLHIPGDDHDRIN